MISSCKSANRYDVGVTDHYQVPLIIQEITSPAGSPAQSPIDWHETALRRWIAASLEHGRHILAVGHQGVLLRFQEDGRDWVIKVPRGRGLAQRFHIASLCREYRAYQRLAGVAGVPVCHGLAAGRYLVLDYLPAVAYRWAKIADRDDWFRRLFNLIRSMHGRGVAHGDLKRKANLFAGEGGQPWILDFGTAYLRRPGWHPVNHALFAYLAQTDLNAWAKHKYHGDYAQAAAAEPGILRYSRLEAAVSRLRKWYDRRGGVK